MRIEPQEKALTDVLNYSSEYEVSTLCLLCPLKTAYTEKEMSHAFVKGTTLMLKFHYDNTSRCFQFLAF